MPFNVLGDGRDRFQVAMEGARGTPAARHADVALPTPGGRTCMVRVTWPIDMPRKLPVVALAAAEGSSGADYDRLAGGLAVGGHFVVMPDTPGPLRGTSAQAAQRAAAQRAAELRFTLDSIPLLRRQLGASANAVDMERCVAIGHREGAWTALGLIGLSRGYGTDTSHRDGRVRGAVALHPVAAPIAAARDATIVGGRGMVVTLPGQAAPPSGSRLLHLSVPARGDTYGGLIGPQRFSARLGQRDGEALAAVAAASLLLFEWAIDGDNDRRRDLLALDGRGLPGVAGPLGVREV
jgi:hypothetical protein